MSLSQLTAFLIPTLALNLTPGPDMFFVLGHSMKSGLPAAAKAALGLWIGYLFHIALVCLGMAALLAKYPQAFTLLKLLGSSYLLILGIKLLLKRGAGEKAGATEERGSLFEGIFVSALNPKVAIFFLAFLPQFVEPGASEPAFQLLLLGLLFSFSSTVVNLGVSTVAYFLRNGGKDAPRFSLERACGLVMVGMAARLVLSP